MPKLPDVLAKNRVWSEATRRADPDFFASLARQQAPRYLWIGCSDSRVPANQIVGLLPGELFVHRNVANVVVHTDLNCLSVLQFAVDVLRVEHVIVCGHYGCGGIQAALRRESLGLIDNWLRHVQDVAEKHEPRLPPARERGARVDRLCELNVIEQALNVCRTTIVQDAWRRAQPLAVHAWVYALQDGLLRDLDFDVSGPSELAARYEQALKARPGGRRLISRAMKHPARGARVALALALLAAAASAAAEETPTTIGDGSKVSIEYTLKLDDGSTADTNVGGAPLVYEQGKGQILPALEKELVGLGVDDTKTLKLSPEQGYGAVDPAAIQRVPASVDPRGGAQAGRAAHGAGRRTASSAPSASRPSRATRSWST